MLRKVERDLVDQNEGLEGDVECGFVCDEEEGAEVCINSG